MQRRISIEAGTTRKLLRRRAVGGFVLTEAAYASRALIHDHEHRHPTITLVVDGVCRERVGTREEQLTPTSVLIKPLGVLHGNDVGHGGSRGFFIAANRADLEVLCRNHRLFDVVTHLVAPALALLGRRARETFWEDAGSDELATEQRILELVAGLGREPAARVSAPPPWLRAIHERLAADYRTPPSLAVLAREAGVHATYVGRAFRRQYGIGPAEFVHRMRVERAARALASGSESVSGIAFATGFADQSHLGRMFKRFVGLSPAEYRRAFGAAAGSTSCRVA